MRFRTTERMSSPNFSDRDEFLHAAPEPLPDRWQENMFFVGWDLDGGHGFLIHTKRWPAKRDHEAHIAIYVGGEVCSVVLHRPTGSTLRMADEIPELSAEAESPWSRWRIEAKIQGVLGAGPFGFIAHLPSGPVEAALDVVLESDLEPADFNAALASWDKTLRESGAEQHASAQAHYEQGGRWKGTLRLGDRVIKTSGLFVRDHSWGIRVESNFDSGVFWTASTLDEGRMFCNAIGFPGPERTIGTGIYVDKTGSYVTHAVAGDFMPNPGLLSYGSAKIHYGYDDPVVLEACTKLHVPKYLPGSGARRYDNNAISYVSIGDKHGMGCIEWAAVLAPEQAAVLDDLLAGAE